MCNTDVLQRNKQKISVIHDNVISYTQAKLIQLEEKKGLRNGLVTLT